MANIKVYDTTLRDGMQAEGVSFSLADKLLITRRLDDFGMDYIEGGYPMSNPKEEEFFKQVKELGLKTAKIVAFGSTRRAKNKVTDDENLQALLACGAPAITLVGKTWDMHVTDVLKTTLDKNLLMCSESVKYMKDNGKEVIFDAEHFYDGYKANPEYAMKVLTAAAEAGADCLALCETNGGNLPHEVYEMTQKVCQAFPTVSVGVHAHNDSDCAVASSLAAVAAGARQVQGTVNGLGERTGNANLCTIIPNLALKMGHDLTCKGNIVSLTELSRFLFEIANLSPATSMPYVGESAFAHKGGLHIDALQKNERSYEHISPDLVGNERRHFRFGKPALLFLGDAGSTFLGFTLAGLAVLGKWSNTSDFVSISAPILIFGVLIFDMIYVNLSRAKNGQAKNFFEFLTCVNK
ncbi:MAG: citramalate synthase, partial [Planctomycetes bacterium]|nr:citramalate synthase [Planctomycetota bacterium]